ncbi:hypothetical protein RQP54_15040 [Curvibacter sp. APW13]|uniref:hypothetical protein n=1 Tax=Curvibacter sp. APW13 TaxID=3077236 RepID=UPI0028DFA292|nr:hypothetical protein [Curvibacter sp. APW13]MDT8992186.1 hypothetical protein [Curvibacter sp. APW13]
MTHPHLGLTMTESTIDLADALNQGCICQTLQPELLQRQLAKDATLQALVPTLQQSHPHLFSSTVVFLQERAFHAMARTVQAIERVTQLPGWQTQVLGNAATDWPDHGLAGAFMGYDFHIGADGPQLIEVNTNAGGAFLNAALARAQAACCAEMDAGWTPYRDMRTLEDDFFAMFRSEWQRQRGDLPLRQVAIVDDTPASQYLAPEFALARAMFESRGVSACIADATMLQWRDGRLWDGDRAIDLVYNRVTDFDLSDPSHTAMASAWRSGAVVLTPDPRTYALRARKSHLVLLSDANALQALGATADDTETLLAHVPRCLDVDASNAAALWEDRRHWFFKPHSGFGSRAVYRGDKLTKRVWESIVQGGYIAQSLVTPGTRSVALAPADAPLKFDIRAYTYNGRVQLLAARMYQGQTTNFRTPGGGFAPVVVVSPTHAQAVQKVLDQLHHSNCANTGLACSTTP